MLYVSDHEKVSNCEIVKVIVKQLWNISKIEEKWLKNPWACSLSNVNALLLDSFA